ncbi:MAG: dapE 2 [Mucilaginibacter sp.]|nr:dapE 2 [Mucilaginibacter sp.]
MSLSTKTEYDNEEQHLAGLAADALLLLKQLIATPSLSGDENKTASLLRQFMHNRGMHTMRLYHNIWAYNKYYHPDKPTILLNSHHDTVKPNEGYSRDPFFPEIIDDKLYGLGSNDAGGCLVSLLALFIYFYEEPNLPYNLCFAATAEEENSGEKGISSILSQLGPLDFALVGEPTQMEMATTEMGCMVLDCTTHGTAGHAARNEGDNALYKALTDIQWFSTFQFPKQSGFMGPVKMTVTEIKAGIQHNIIPSECHFTVDVRLSNCYPVEESPGDHSSAHELSNYTPARHTPAILYQSFTPGGQGWHCTGS